MTQTKNVFDTTNLPEGDWPLYRKKVLTRAVRIDGPFTVQTSEGLMSCADGYLATDARGYPYPIATDEFNLIYTGAGVERTDLVASGDQPTMGSQEWIDAATDRELLVFIAVNLSSIGSIVKNVGEQVQPTIEKLSPFLKSMGLG